MIPTNNSTEQFTPRHSGIQTLQSQLAQGLNPQPAKPAHAHALHDPAANTAAPSPDNNFTFLDFLDIINPLQHIPVVNLAYRAITGDHIKSSSEIIGGSIFSGPIGAASGIINAIIREETGKDLTGNILAALRDDTTAPSSPQNTAQSSANNSAADILATPITKTANYQTQHIDKYTSSTQQRPESKLSLYS